MLAVVYKIPGAGSWWGGNLRVACVLFHWKICARNPFSVDWLPGMGNLRTHLFPTGAPDHWPVGKILNPIGRINFTAHWIMDAGQRSWPEVGDDKAPEEKEELKQNKQKKRRGFIRAFLLFYRGRLSLTHFE